MLYLDGKKCHKLSKESLIDILIKLIQNKPVTNAMNSILKQ